MMIEEAWLKVIEEEGMTGAAAYVRMDEEMIMMVILMTETTVIAPCIC